jgi:putative alpha-1,2-mannosidase
LTEKMFRFGNDIKNMVMNNMVKYLLLFVLGCLTVQCSDPGSKKTPVDYVSMYIGTINPKTKGTTPVIKVPGGNISLFPLFTPEMEDLYLADKIYGFPLGIGNLMISTGKVKTGVKENASKFDHDLETATPYYYQALLEDPDINAEFTLTENTVIFRFTLPGNETSNLLLNLSGNASVEIKNNNIIEGSGSNRSRSSAANAENKNYFYAELSKPLTSCGTWQNDTIASGSKSKTGRRIGIYTSYQTIRSEILELRIGFSSKSIDEARSFITNEIGSQTFDKIKNRAKGLWNKELNLIKIKGGTEKQRSIFYSTLHRTRALRMGNVWDTYRCAYPLQSIIKPEETIKAIQGFVKRYEETGWLPSSGAMIGNHSTAVIVDAYMKGLRGFDIEKAYEGMKKNAMQATMIPWKDAGYITELEQCYFDNGFYPALPVSDEFKVTEAAKLKEKLKEDVDIYSRLPYQVKWLPETGVKEWVKEVDSWHRRQSVSVTLEHCYDDWCLAIMAKELGKEEDYKLFMKRALNYRNLFNPAIGMMAPKSADGQWIEPFDPRFSGGFAGEGFFAEANSWTYTWHVQHDVQGLINLMGGRDNFISKLDALFTTGRTMDKLAFLGQFPDMTGLIGMYTQGNEPAFHIPYLYNYAGQPWKTQSRVRQIMDLWYDTTPFGLSGDEDGGAMSSWYVFNAMGFYPQCPGRPIFDIGSPVFEKTIINVGNGKTFVIEAKDVSAQNKYIQSAALNGEPLNKPWFNNSDLVKGGKLVLIMGPRPNRNWGSSPDEAPPSISAQLHK